MAEQSVLALSAAVMLALIHLLSGKLRFLSSVPRSRWLSAFGGVSVAYVFVHLLPELAEGQRTLEREQPGTVLEFLEDHVYLTALAGLVLFYGVENHSLRSREERRRGDEEIRRPPPPSG